MENTNNIMTSLNVTAQIPLNRKEYCINETTLQNLGINNNLAYTYYKGLEVTCIEERTKWEWKEVEDGDIVLMATSFVYPNGLIVDGIDYSNKIYNFVKLQITIPEVNQNNFVRQLFINIFDLPDNYNEQDICDYILNLPEEERTILETDSKWNVIIFEASS